MKLLLGSMLVVCSAFAGTPLVPLFWTQGQPPETIRKVVREVAEGGNTGFVWESRPHPDYLGPQWWGDLRVAVDEAKKLGLEVWIFDEWMYPSGIAGGKVVEQNPDFANHVVADRSMLVKANDVVDPGKVPGGLKDIEKLVSVVAFQKGQDPVDLTGKASWTARPGEWRVVWCVTYPLRPRKGWRMDNMIDVLNPEAVHAFLRITHDATYERFKDDFGKTIKGFFSDEVGFRNITSYDSLPGKPGMPMPWSPVFSAYFRKLKGYDPAPLVASLWYDLGPRGRAARFDLMDAYSRAFAENFFKPQQEWCRQHGVRFIGHVVEDNHADHQLGYGPGHWFRAMQYFDVPGIDIVGYQVTPGMDAGGNHWVVGSGTVWDEEFFQFEVPAIARGEALMKGTREIFSEAFGANGWAEGLRMQKWIGDWHIANGIGFLSPHAVTMKYHDPDCPPHFNRTSGNPQWRYYATWAEYFKRLQKVIAESEPVYDAAVLYTAESRWTGPAQTAGPVVRALAQRQRSSVVLPYEVFASQGSMEGGRWVYNGQRFGTVILPWVKYAPAEVMRRLAEMAKAGVRVVAIDRWPVGSVDGRGDDVVKAAVEELKRSPRAAAIPVTELDLGPDGILPENPNLFVARRKTADGEWILLQNRSLTANVRGPLNLAGKVARFDAERGAFVKMGPELDIPPYGLWCLRVSDRLPAAEPARHFTSVTPFAGSWTPALSQWRRGFSGTITYRTTLTVDSPEKPLALDLGEVREIAELKVNGKPAGVRIAPPYRFDLTGLVRAGENSVEVDVTNTAQAMWADDFSHGEAMSGVFGPVQVHR